MHHHPKKIPATAEQAARLRAHFTSAEAAARHRGHAAEQLTTAFMEAVEQLDLDFENPVHRRLLEVYMASRERGFPAPRRKDGAA